LCIAYCALCILNFAFYVHHPILFFFRAKDGLLILIDEIVQETAMDHMPTSWYYVPVSVKNELVLSANRAW
jgi:hypothetical protein